MLTMKPTFIQENGKAKFVVFSMKDFAANKDALEDAEDLRILDEAKRLAQAKDASRTTRFSKNSDWPASFARPKSPRPMNRASPMLRSNVSRFHRRHQPAPLRGWRPSHRYQIRLRNHPRTPQAPRRPRRLRTRRDRHQKHLAPKMGNRPHQSHIQRPRHRRPLPHHRRRPLLNAPPAP